MSTARAIFNEVAALTAGFHGAMAGAKVGIVGSSMLLMAAGLGTATGVVPLAFCLATAAATTAAGAAIGYKGAKALLDPDKREAMLERASDFGRALHPSRVHKWHRAGFDM